MRTRITFALGLALAFAPLTAGPAAAQGPVVPRVVLPTDRTVLPIPEPKVPAEHRGRCPQCHAAAAVRGQGAGHRAERPDRADRRHGLRHVERLRRAHPHADGRAPGEQRAALQPLPHHGALLADPGGAAHGPQPSHEQHGLDHGDGHRVSRPDRPAAQQRGAAGGDAAAERLQHRRLRQDPRDGGLGSQPVRPDRSLADPLGLRQVLRLHRRRDQPVGADALRRA